MKTLSLFLSCELISGMTSTVIVQDVIDSTLVFLTFILYLEVMFGIFLCKHSLWLVWRCSLGSCVGPLLQHLAPLHCVSLLGVLDEWFQGAQNVKEQVSSFYSLDLVVIQNLATNLMNFKNPKSINGNRRPKFSEARRTF